MLKYSKKLHIKKNKKVYNVIKEANVILPAYCAWYMQNNYTNIYQTMKILPDELQTADTSNVTIMHGMFFMCSNLKTIPLLDTSKVIDMSTMFYQCTKLTTIPLLNTSNVTDMEGMFEHCSSLTTIPQINTSKVTNMDSMFYWCKSLTSIPQLDTSNVTTMSYMFQYCTSLPATFEWIIDCSSITNGIEMYGIFEYSSVKEVTFKNVKANIASCFTANNLGSQLTKITIQNTIA